MKILTKLLAISMCFALTSCGSVGKKAVSDVGGYSENSGNSQYSENSDSTENSVDVSVQSEKKENTILTYATYTEINYGLQEMIDNFNNENNGYQIVVKDYSDELSYENPEMKAGASEESLSAVQMEIVQDVINGEIDIVNSNIFPDRISFDSLKNKGAFVNLYTFMENDPDINCSTLNENILHLFEYDGELYDLPTFFAINTLIGDSQYVGTKENWTFDEFVSYWEKMPEGSTIAGSREKHQVFFTILRNILEDFIDYKNGKAYFDSPEFAESLEFCNRFDYAPIGTKNELDSTSPDFVQNCFITGIWSFHRYVEENDTLVGYPSSDGTGAYVTVTDYDFAVNRNSSDERQQGAWQFIRKFADEEYQTKYYAYYDDNVIEPFYYEESGIPINNKVFEEMSLKIMKGEIYSSVMSVEGNPYDIGLPTQAEYNRLLDYINSIKYYKVEDYSLWTILDDDIDAYFSGEKTLEETVEIIQSRTSILASEKS